MEIKISIIALILAIILYTISMLSIGVTIGLMTNNKVNIEHYHAEQTVNSVIPKKGFK